MKHVLVVAAMAVAPACVPYSATTGAAKNGEQLGFRASQKRYQVTERQVTGEADHYDSAGNYRGTTQRVKYVNRTTLGEREVQFFQGDERIGEADYYRIGGDPDAERLAEERQRRMFWMNAGGWVASAGAAAGLTAASLGAGGTTGTTLIYTASSVLGAVGGWLIAKTFRYRKDARLSLRRAAEIGVRF
jgi:hypothetical protein